MKILISLLFIYLFNDAYCQKNILDYDFQKNKYSDNTKFVIENNNTAQFKISNINRFIYDVTISVSKSSFSSSTPPGKFTELTKSLTSKVENEASNPQTETSNKGESGDAESLETVKSNPADIENLKKFEDLIISHLDKISETYNSLIDISKLDNSFEEINKLKNIVVKTNLSVVDTRELIYYCNSMLTQATELYSKLTYGDLVSAEKTKFEKLKSEYDKANYKETINNFLQLYNEINETNFTFSSEPIVADFENADEIKFKIEIKSKDDKNTGKNREFEVPVTVTGGFKIDFSAGVFGTNLYDHSFSTVRDSVLVDTIYEKGYKIVKDNQGNFNFGINTLMHFSYKWRNFGVGANFGIGLMGDPQTLRYLIGGSFIMGSLKRFILNGGVSFGSVSRLSSSIKENTFYGGDQPSSVQTTKETLIGWYLGVSYNF